MKEMLCSNPWRSVAAALSLVLVSAAPPRAEQELVVTGDGLMSATVNGVPGRIRVDPAVWSMPLIGGLWAHRAGLRGGMFGFGFLVGPRQVDGASAVARIAIGVGAGPRRRRIGWTARSYAADADGVVGPGGVPQRVVRFVLRPSIAGERTVALPLVDDGGLFGGWGGIYARIEVDGRPMRVRFDPRHALTLATAGAGVRLASTFDGRLSGETRPVEIAFGISRPVRTLRLARPLTIGSLSISTLGVRTSDFGDAATIREEGGDPDEIVVTGRRRGNNDRDRIALGADALERCSSIVFDKPARQIRLTCA